MFVPKLFSTLKNYTLAKFTADLIAGVIVGIVALPLAIAFGIASGVTPEKGLITAIVAGFLISALGGSRVQIGGPTGAFIVIVYGIVQQYGISGLIISTFMAGIILILMGVFRMGVFIKFIPHPLIVGFTTGIALVIFSSQMNDFFGLQIEKVPADFVEKWMIYFENFNQTNLYAIGISFATLIIAVSFGKITKKIPGTLIAIIVTTAAVTLLNIPVETIGSRFGTMDASLPTPEMSGLSWVTIRSLIQPAFTIALLGAIESLLSAVVSDGMIGGNHKSNMELVGQGVANIGSALFGGIPATGAIARTATNVRNGGRTPVAGIIHSITLLVIMLFAGKWARLIPMSCLAGILVIVAYNMSEWRSFKGLLKGPREDAIVLVTTFLLTVFIDLTVAIEIGILLAAFLFIRRLTLVSKVKILTNASKEVDDEDDAERISNYHIPKGVEVFEIKGPFFFGAAYKFKEAAAFIESPPKILIIRMRFVPVIDATAIHTLKQVTSDIQSKGTIVLLSGVQAEVLNELSRSGYSQKIGEDNILPDIKTALEYVNTKYGLF